ncbi:hypothetical protein BDR26DRAFT_861997 [Obelidium mucronatum]|nr:hypothetical protein BDR26DRAFT_861997 [Obelidium mucronatum]
MPVKISFDGGPKDAQPLESRSYKHETTFAMGAHLHHATEPPELALLVPSATTGHLVLSGAVNPGEAQPASLDIVVYSGVEPAAPDFTAAVDVLDPRNLEQTAHLLHRKPICQTKACVLRTAEGTYPFKILLPEETPQTVIFSDSNKDNRFPGGTGVENNTRDKMLLGGTSTFVFVVTESTAIDGELDFSISGREAIIQHLHPTPVLERALPGVARYAVKEIQADLSVPKYFNLFQQLLPDFDQDVALVLSNRKITLTIPNWHPLICLKSATCVWTETIRHPNQFDLRHTSKAAAVASHDGPSTTPPPSPPTPTLTSTMLTSSNSSNYAPISRSLSTGLNTSTAIFSNRSIGPPSRSSSQYSQIEQTTPYGALRSVRTLSKEKVEISDLADPSMGGFQHAFSYPDAHLLHPTTNRADDFVVEHSALVTIQFCRIDRTQDAFMMDVSFQQVRPKIRYLGDWRERGPFCSSSSSSGGGGGGENLKAVVVVGEAGVNTVGEAAGGVSLKGTVKGKKSFAGAAAAGDGAAAVDEGRSESRKFLKFKWKK